MIMKNIIISGVIFAFLLSCNDEFMERYPLDKVSDQTFWSTQKDLELYCNNFYATSFPVGNEIWGTERDGFGIYVMLPYRDLITDNSASLDYEIIPAGQYIVPTPGGSGGWNWVNIRRLNYFLDNYNRVNINESIKKIYAGEIMFFKTIAYFEKVKFFGDVPWLTKVVNIDSPELYGERTPRSQVMDSILKLIDTAIEWLPAKGSEATDRLNKDMALFLKARICLYEGTYRKYHPNLGLEGAKFLNEAVTACEGLMGKNYSLYSTGDVNNDYYKLFAPPNYSYSGNPEMILWKKYSESQQLGTAFQRYYVANSVQQGATRSLVEEYLCIDGLPASISPMFMGSDSIQSEFMNRDPRLTQTICNFGERLLEPGVFWQGNNPLPTLNGMPNEKCPTGFRICKWWEDDETEINRVLNGQQPFPIYRYAEILLTYAEAKFELGQCTQDVIDNSINLIRTRAGMPPLNISNVPSDPKLDAIYQQYCGYSPAPLLREIRRERRIEFAFENTRWDDLMRWKAGKFLEMTVQGIRFLKSQFPMVVVNQDVFLSDEGYILPYKVTLPNGRVFDENKHYLFPIPIEDLVLNPNLVQNPGWASAN